MEATKTINLEYSISSEIAEVPKIVNVIITYLQVHTPISGCECVFDIKVVLSELISNAVIHGNGSDKTKPVEIIVFYENGTLEFTVIDRGKEFTPEDQEQETLLCENHRGITICHILCKKLIYKFIEDKGNSAKAVFILKEYKGGR